MTPDASDEEATRVVTGRSLVGGELRRELDRAAEDRKRPTIPPAPRSPSSHPAPPLLVPSEVPRGMPRVVIASLIVSALLTAAGLWALAYLKSEGFW